LLKSSRDDSLSLSTDPQTGLGPNPLNAYTNHIRSDLKSKAACLKKRPSRGRHFD